MDTVFYSKKKWNSRKVKYWKENLRPPWRPSRGDIKNYEKGLKIIQPPRNILILGATPELRDLAGRLGKKIWVADYSLKMISEMGKMMKSAGQRKEKRVSGDWCNLKNLEQKSFDVVFGDLVLRLIEPAKRRFFLRKISSLLKQKGIFITRIHFVDESLGKLSVEEIIERSFSLLDRNIPGKGTEVKNLLISRLLDKYYPKGAPCIRRKVRTDIGNYLAINPWTDLNKKTILKGVLNRFERRRLVNFYSQTRKEVEEDLKSHFLIKKRLIVSDYIDSKFFPIYFLSSADKINKI